MNSDLDNADTSANELDYDLDNADNIENVLDNAFDVNDLIEVDDDRITFNLLYAALLNAH